MATMPRLLALLCLSAGLACKAPASTDAGPGPDAGPGSDALDAGDGIDDAGAPDAGGSIQPDAGREDAGSSASVELAFVGGGDGVIRTYRVDDDGRFTPLESLLAGGNPSYLAFDGARRLVFAVDEAQGRVRSFRVDPETGALTRINHVNAGEEGVTSGVTHLSLTPSGRHLLLAHYGSGHVSVVPVEVDGTLGTATAVASAGHQAHFAQQVEGTVYVVCLGANHIARYRLDEAAGTLSALTPVATGAGVGPRHLAFAPAGGLAFVVNESASSLSSYAWDAAAGGLTLLDTRGTVPPGAPPNTGAAVQVHPAGRWVYVSNRGHNSIARLAYGDAGVLTLEATVPSFGNLPRSFSLSPDGTRAWVANQSSGTIFGYQVSASDGALIPLDTEPLVSGLTTPYFVGAARFAR